MIFNKLIRFLEGVKGDIKVDRMSGSADRTNQDSLRDSEGVSDPEAMGPVDMTHWFLSGVIVSLTERVLPPSHVIPGCSFA